VGQIRSEPRGVAASREPVRCCESGKRTAEQVNLLVRYLVCTIEAVSAGINWENA